MTCTDVTVSGNVQPNIKDEVVTWYIQHRSRDSVTPNLMLSNGMQWLYGQAVSDHVLVAALCKITRLTLRHAAYDSDVVTKISCVAKIWHSTRSNLCRLGFEDQSPLHPSSPLEALLVVTINIRQAFRGTGSLLCLLSLLRLLDTLDKACVSSIVSAIQPVVILEGLLRRRSFNS